MRSWFISTGRSSVPKCPEPEARGRSLIVHCTGCKGRSDLSSRGCFMGVARRITPGFGGEVVMAGAVDRSYSGPIVDALVCTSEILDRMDGLLERISEMKGGPFLRRKRTRAIESVIEAFLSDPEVLLAKGETIREGLTILSKGDECGLETGFDDIMDRTSLMVRRLRSSV